VIVRFTGVDGILTIVSSAVRVDGRVAELDGAGFQKVVDERQRCAPSRGFRDQAEGRTDSSQW